MMSGKVGASSKVARGAGEIGNSVTKRVGDTSKVANRVGGSTSRVGGGISRCKAAQAAQICVEPHSTNRFLQCVPRSANSGIFPDQHS